MSGVVRERCIGHTMNSDVATVFQPADEHFQAVFGQSVPKPRCLHVVVAEVGGGVIFALATSEKLIR